MLRTTTRKLFPVLFTLALMFGAASAEAQRQGPSKTTYKTAKTASLRVGASNMTRTPAVKNELGTVTARRLKHDGVVSVSPSGAVEKHQVSTRKGNGAGQPAATAVVSVRKMKDGSYKAYHAKNAKLNKPAAQSSRSGTGSESSPAPRRRGGSESRPAPRRRGGSESRPAPRPAPRRRGGSE